MFYSSEKHLHTTGNLKQLSSKLPCTITKFIWCISILTFTNSNCSTYTGLTSNTFKQRYYGHRHSFKYRVSDHSTTLSSHIWDLRDENENYEIQWSIIDRAPDFNPITRKCRLCIKEKYYIIFQPEGASLNQNKTTIGRHLVRFSFF